MINCKECKFYKDTCECDIKYTKFGTVFDHTLHVLDLLPDNSTFEVQIAALLHDIGKNEKTYDTVDGKQRFIGHELLGSKIAKRRLENLKFSSNEINKISFLIEHHMDVYKLEGKCEKVGFNDYFNKNGVCIIEWSDMICDCLPEERLQIDFKIIDENTRVLVLKPYGQKYVDLVESVL